MGVNTPSFYVFCKKMVCFSAFMWYFVLIMIDHDCDLLCTRVLYRQRFFQSVPKLVEHYHHAADPVKCNFLIALAYMLQGVPRAVLNMSLPEVSNQFS
jgi:hypothetical protein